jgi:hypothetical protein
MRVMVFAKATEVGGEAAPPAAEAFAAMDRFTEELVKAGVFVAAAGLKNSAEAKRMVCEGPSRTITDGPFAETREQLWGFYTVEMPDIDAVIDPCLALWEAAHGTVEIRPMIPVPTGAAA